MRLATALYAASAVFLIFVAITWPHNPCCTQWATETWVVAPGIVAWHVMAWYGNGTVRSRTGAHLLVVTSTKDGLRRQAGTCQTYQ